MALFSIVPMGRAKDDDELVLSNSQYRYLMDFIVKHEWKARYNCRMHARDIWEIMKDLYVGRISYVVLVSRRHLC